MSCRIATTISPFSRAFSSFLKRFVVRRFYFFIIFFFPLLFSSLSFIVLFLCEELYFITEENEVVTKERD